MRITKEQLIRRLEPGDKVRWSAENSSVSRDACTVKTISLDGRCADIVLSGPRTGKYKIQLDRDGSIDISSIFADEDLDSHGELKWISLVAGDGFRT